MRLKQHTYIYNANAEPPGQSHPPQIRIGISIIKSPAFTPQFNIATYINRNKETKHTPVHYITRGSHKSGRRASK